MPSLRFRRLRIWPRQSIASSVSTGALVLALLGLLAPTLAAQQPEPYVKVSVTPDRPGWVYRPGEPVRFQVAVLSSGHPISRASVRFEVGPEMVKPRASGPLALQNGRTVLDGGTMTEPGFLRATVIAEVDGKEYRGLGTAGFAPEAIQPATSSPEDFAEFWQNAIVRARNVPLNPVMTLLPEQSTADVSVYHVSFQNERAGSRIYGILSAPTRPGRYPALLSVPGAGVRPYSGNVALAREGYLHLSIGIHGVPVNLAPGVYTDLGAGALAGYWAFNLDDRERYYYRRVILGAVRAGDFLHALPQFDGQNYAVYGGSQGGALAIITAALDPRVRALAAAFPALSDHEGYLKGRAGGWPHLFSEANRAANATPEKIRTARYYDVVNFARLLRVPGFYTWGFNDVVCPPTSMYAAFNVIQAPKELFVVPDIGHTPYPEQWERLHAWLRRAVSPGPGTP